MFVVHIITGLYDGGAEAVLYRLCTTSMDDTNIVISLMGAGKYGPLLEQAGIKVECLSMPQGNITVNGLLTLWRLIRHYEPDVVQTWMHHANLIGGVIARIAGIRLICWGIHSTTLEPTNSKRTTLLTVRLCAYLSRLIPARIISCSARAVQVHKALGYVPEKFILIPNGYDLRQFRENGESRLSVRYEWDVDADTPLLGMVARFDPLKDHGTLISALGLLRERGILFCCALVGTDVDDDNQSLKELVAAQRVDTQVVLAGPRSDIPAVMNALDLHILSSSGEAFPNVLAEAMACGTPCVTTDVGDAALIVGSTGWVVPPRNPEYLADAIIEALTEAQDTAAWQIRRADYRQRILDNFSLAGMVESYRAVWDSLTQNDGDVEGIKKPISYEDINELF